MRTNAARRIKLTGMASEQPPPAPPGPAPMIGRYRLGPTLGAGGMAEVFRAEDTRLSRVVALKVLRPALAADTTFRTRFESEARAAAALAHPNVVSIFDVGEEVDGRPYIVMELVEGGNLAERAARLPLTTAEAVGLMQGVLSGLGAAHEAGLLHRDIKPGNILLARDGSAKVADFGIAKALTESQGAMDLTGTSLVLGTPRYLAPERAMGQPATVQSDLWAAGVVLYEMVAGQPPYTGSTAFELVAAAQSGQVASPPSSLSPADLAVLDVAIRAMDPDPAKRFTSAAAMSSALATAARAAGWGPQGQSGAGVGPGPDATWAMPAAGSLTATVPYSPAGDPTAVAASPSATVPYAAAPRPAEPTPPGSMNRHWRLTAVLAALLLVVILALILGLGSGSPQPPVRTTTTTRPATTTSSPATTTSTPATALANLVRDATAGETSGSVDHASAQNIINQAQQAVTDSASGNSSQAVNDLQQAAMAISQGLQHGTITGSAATLLQQDLTTLADVLGLGAAATAPTTAPPGPGGHHKPGNGNG
ncbi:MAG TPA: protein kinase [Acidimicrobiales bacterium]|nr:protein kinase [Acidimicrobiales bacterium]